ncbi:MAG: response regulator transcription factor [Anaerolineales bacterium]|nr:response regulator transcription factor [Anaerolineales bacterium]
MERGKILVVDDEPKLVRLVREVLTAAGYSVLSTGRGENAVEMAAMERPDLVILDVVLAGAMDGFGVAQRVREFSDVPIIMLTARDRETDLVRGFEQGADDYITKPFSSKELLVRVRAVIRRSRKESVAADEVELACGELRIDLPRRKLTVGGQEVHLTPTEYRLLHELAVHKNQVMLHSQLLAAVWGPEYRDDLEYLRAYIRYLRQKVEADPGHPVRIVTSPGVGYMLACPDEPD